MCRHGKLSLCLASQSMRVYLFCLISEGVSCLCCLHGDTFCKGEGSQNSAAFNIAIGTFHTYTHSYSPSMQTNRGDRVHFIRRCYIRHTHSLDLEPTTSISSQFLTGWGWISVHIVIFPRVPLYFSISPTNASYDESTKPCFQFFPATSHSIATNNSPATQK